MPAGFSHSVLPALPITIYAPDARSAIDVPPKVVTLDGFREWAVSDESPKYGRRTYASGGVIVDMRPASFENHNLLKVEISSVLYRLAREMKLGKFYADGTLISNEQAGLSNEPDAAFASYESIRSGRVAFPPLEGEPRAGMEIVGTVDWVLEVVSNSSIKKDTVLLRKAYFDAGIPEYWLIDALEEQLDFQVLVPGEGEYKPVAPQDGWLASPTFKKSFKLERVLDENGFVEYTLHMK